MIIVLLIIIVIALIIFPLLVSRSAEKNQKNKC